jgi:hypothetical protein
VRKTLSLLPQVTNLKRLLDNGIADHLNKLTEIGDAASRQAVERACSP